MQSRVSYPVNSVNYILKCMPIQTGFHPCVDKSENQSGSACMFPCSSYCLQLCLNASVLAVNTSVKPAVPDARGLCISKFVGTVQIINVFLIYFYIYNLKVNDLLSTSILVNRMITRCSAIAERPRCRVRYSFRQK